MKKLLSFVAGLLVAISGFALDFSYTADPAAGTVTELETITLTFPNVYELEPVSVNDITLKRDGEPVAIKASVPYGSKNVVVKLNEKATADGKYVLDIPAGSVSAYEDDTYEISADNEAISLTYTIGGEAPVENKFAYTVTPEPGDVESFDKVTLTFTDKTWSQCRVENSEGITVTRDGAPIKFKANYPIGASGAKMAVTNLEDDKTTPGEYVITFAAGSLRCDVKGYKTDESQTNPEPIVLTYTVNSAGGDTPGGGDDPAGDKSFWYYTVDPAAGAVTELETITLTYPNVYELDVNHVDEITLKRDGEPVAIKASVPYGSKNVVVKLSEKATAAGKYVLDFPAASFLAYEDDTYATTVDNEAFSLTYTIENQAPATLDFTMSADPADNSAVLKLDKVVVTFPNLESVTVEEGFPAVMFNNGFLAENEYSVSVQANVVTVDIAIDIEGPIDLMVAFPGYTVTGKKGDVTGTNTEDLILNYSILAPVAYDITSLNIGTPRPNAQGEISAEKSLTSIIFYSEVKDLVAADGSEPNVTIKQVNGDFERSGRLSKGFGFNANYTYFSVDFGAEPTFNGEYEITVAKGAFGDALWAENPEVGHANDEIKLKFTLIDGKDVDLNTLTASVNPVAGTYDSFDKIATVTVSFEGEMTPVDGAGATLVSENPMANYNKTATFIKAENGFSVTFPAPEIASTTENYRFNVPAGQFKNAEGLGNAEISLVYTVDKQSGVNSIVIDEVKDNVVFTINGVRVSSKTLTPGLYIINGQKVLVK